MIKNIILFPYRFYAIVIFFLLSSVMMLAFVISFNLFPGERGERIVHKLTAVWAKLTFIILFIRARIKNKTMIDANKQYVFISNHRSLLDVPTWALSCSNFLKYLSKEELIKAPVFGYVIKRMYVTVQRSDRGDRYRSIEKMRAALRHGISIFLAPEGTRNKTNQTLLEFKDGAFRLALLEQKPLAILTLYNSDKLMHPSNPLSLQPGTIYGEWCGIMDTTGLTEDDLPKVKAEAYARMEKSYNQLKAKH